MTRDEPTPAASAAETWIRRLQQAVGSLARTLGGRWTVHQGREFTADLPAGQFPALPCSAPGADPDPADGRHFALTVFGPGHPDPQSALDLARAWGVRNGWAEVESGQGIHPRQGGRFLTLDGPGRPLLSVNVSTLEARITSRTPCSTDPSVLEHVRDQGTAPRPPARFAAPPPAPAPERTRFGISE